DPVVLCCGNIPAARGVPEPIAQIGALPPGFPPDEILDLGDHAAHARRVLQLPAPVQLVQPQPLEGRPLVLGAADRAADLRDSNATLGISDGPAPTPSPRAG